MSTVAKTILTQLGGNRFAMLTGAKNFLSHDNTALSFRLPTNTTKNKCNYIKITLNGNDLYDVEFIRIYASKITEISNFKGVYNDSLVSLFESETGLYTSF